MKTTTAVSSYEQQAIDFARTHNIKLTIISVGYKKHFDNDKEERFVFKMKLTRNGKSYTFNFGQSIAEGINEPSIYSVLACLTKYDVGTFEDFCNEFGYDTDSRTAEKTYRAVVKEFKAVDRLFSDIIDELQEIA